MIPVARFHAGFTLLETLSALAVAAVVLSMSVTSLHKVVLDSRRATTVNELFGAVHMARSESLKRGGYVTICASTNGTLCAGSTDWTKGWLVYFNADRDTSGLEPDAGEPILNYAPNGNDGVRISSGGRTHFSFRPFTINSDNGTFTLCDERGVTEPRARRAIVVNTVGRPRVTDRKPDGSDLVCP